METQREKYTVVLAISDPGACVATRHTVNRDDRFEIVREVPNAVMAIDACNVLHPDLLVIADDSPGLRGTEVLGEIRLNSPDTHVILVATYDASYLRDSEHSFIPATIAVAESITDALETIARMIENPDHTQIPERRRTDRRVKQDWTKVFAERRTAGRREIEDVS